MSYSIDELIDSFTSLDACGLHLQDFEYPVVETCPKSPPHEPPQRRFRLLH